MKKTIRDRLGKAAVKQIERTEWITKMNIIRKYEQRYNVGKLRIKLVYLIDIIETFTNRNLDYYSIDRKAWYTSLKNNHTYTKPR